MTTTANPNADTRRIRELAEALTKMKLNEALEKELTDAASRRLYELTGKSDTRQLVQLTGMSAGKISKLWQRWYSIGIITKRGKFYYKLFGDEEGSQ